MRLDQPVLRAKEGKTEEGREGEREKDKGQGDGRGEAGRGRISALDICIH